MNARTPQVEHDELSEHIANNRHFDRAPGVQAVKVLPGEYSVASSDVVLVTMLGSSVSAFLREREYARRIEGKEIAGDVELFLSTASRTEPQAICGRLR